MQRLKRAIKRMAAVSSGALMLGATALGAAAAADLTDYPAPFIQDGTWSTLLVVGTGGTNPAGLASDIAGAVDIATRLGQEATTSSSTTTTVSGGESEDVALGGAIATTSGGAHNLATTLKDDDIAGLLDSSITWDDGDGSTDYDIEEQIVLGDTTLLVDVSALSTGDEDYGAEPAVELSKDDITYYYVFTDIINLTKIDSDHALPITFLGQDVKITSATSTSITAEIGTEYYMTVGDSVEVDGKTVTLKDVSSSSTATVVVDVDGESEVVSTTAETVNGVKIDAQEAFYSDTKADRSATLLMGEETSKTYDDADPYIGQDKDDPDWVWDIAGMAPGTKVATTVGTTHSLGIEFDQTYNDNDDPVLKPGDCLESPNNYFSLCFDSLTVSDWVDYQFEYDSSIELDEITGNYTSFTSAEKGILISTSEDEGFTTNNQSANTDTLYVVVEETANVTHVVYKDSSNVPTWDASYSTDATLSEIADITYQDTTKNLYLVYDAAGMDLTTGNLSLWVEDANDNNITSVWFTSSDDISGLGATASTEEASEVTYSGTNIGTKDSDLMTRYGMIIKDPGSNGANDDVVIQVPSEQVYANIAVKGTGTTTTTSGDAVTINSIAGVPLVKLDTEVTDKTSKPLILVGGPAVNKLSAEALGVTYPSYGAASTIPENKALIKLVENAFGGTNVALVVAGWEASDTRDAANVLKDFGSYDLSGKAVEVSGTTVTAVASTTTTE